MPWVSVLKEPLTTPDGVEVEVEVFEGETRIEPKLVTVSGIRVVAGPRAHGAKAAVFSGEDDRLFQVLAWVPAKKLEEARYAVRSEARRRVMTGDWEPEGSYDITASLLNS